MRVAQFAVVAALIAVLSVIAYDLHRLADASDYLLGRGHYDRTVSVAEHDRQLQRMTQDALHDVDVILATPDPPKAKPTKK